MIERIWPEGWPQHFTFPAACEVDGWVVLSGMTASNEVGEIQCPGDIAGQARYILQKAERTLESVGLSMSDVVFTRDFITTTEGYGATGAVRREVFGENLPAATGVIVAGLLRSGALIEIEVVAHRGG